MAENQRQQGSNVAEKLKPVIALQSLAIANKDIWPLVFVFKDPAPFCLLAAAGLTLFLMLNVQPIVLQICHSVLCGHIRVTA